MTPEEKMREIISSTCDELKEMLLAKNKSYGNSVLEPINVHSKLGPIEAIKVRLDDKLKRLQKQETFKNEDTMKDYIGYLILQRCVEKYLSNSFIDNNTPKYQLYEDPSNTLKNLKEMCGCKTHELDLSKFMPTCKDYFFSINQEDVIPKKPEKLTLKENDERYVIKKYGTCTQGYGLYLISWINHLRYNSEVSQFESKYFTGIDFKNHHFNTARNEAIEYLKMERDIRGGM